MTFQFHVADSYAGMLRDAGDDGPSDGPGTQRAKVTSTSDPQGEWVTIMESGATTNMFSGMVSLSSDAASSGTAGVCTEARVDLDADGGVCQGGTAYGYADGGVWVQDSDTVTVDYHDSSGAVVSSDTLTVDTVEPQISNISGQRHLHQGSEPDHQLQRDRHGLGIDIRTWRRSH